ncbi:MAG: carboxypeptidase-like regulatory domain-containing protein, partial [Streptosporangiaceae bacterium]
PQAAGRAASFTVTGAGRYSLIGLAPGRYRVRFSSGCGASGYATQWWKDAGSAARATIVTVRASGISSGINAALRR